MKVTVAVEIEAPDGATHYCGNPADDPLWYKRTQVAGFSRWWFYNGGRWLLSGFSHPHGIKELIDLKGPERAGYSAGPVSDGGPDPRC